MITILTNIINQRRIGDNMSLFFKLGDIEPCDPFWNLYWDYQPRGESDNLRGLDYGEDGRRFDF